MRSILGPGTNFIKMCSGFWVHFPYSANNLKHLFVVQSAVVVTRVSRHKRGQLIGQVVAFLESFGWSLLTGPGVNVPIPSNNFVIGIFGSDIWVLKRLIWDWLKLICNCIRTFESKLRSVYNKTFATKQRLIWDKKTKISHTFETR